MAKKPFGKHGSFKRSLSDFFKKFKGKFKRHPPQRPVQICVEIISKVINTYDGKPLPITMYMFDRPKSQLSIAL